MSKKVKLYGLDLITPINFEKLMTKEFVDKISSFDGFVSIAPYGSPTKEANFYNSQSTAALFDTAYNRNKAYNELSKTMKCAIILEVAEVSEEYLPRMRSNK